MSVLCIIPGPNHLYATEADDKATRWCFSCRAHLAHVWELWGDPPPVFPELIDWPELDGYARRELRDYSYYDPTWRLRCPAGHSDTEFPRGLW